MLKILLVAGLGFIATQANAQSCPDFFRFVDFGLQDSEGTFSRGGVIFRAESFDGAPLLIRDNTVCRKVRDIAPDGHGNPVPVVTSVTYSAEKTGINLTSLRVSHVEDTQVSADENAKLHHQNLDSANRIKGQSFLCAVAGDVISCQVVPPYLRDADLVIYCDQDQCRMPVLAVDGNIQVSAGWAMDATNWGSPELVGEAIVAKIQKIHDFLKPLTSGL